MPHRIYVDVKNEADAMIIQQVIHEALWRQRALRQGREDFRVHLIDLPEEDTHVSK